MRVLPKPIAFDWDKGNSQKNVDKHKVSIQESEEVFNNEPFIIAEDSEHSTTQEQRFEGLGKTKEKRKLFVSFTIRKNKIRVISIRDMSKREEAIYETI